MKSEYVRKFKYALFAAGLFLSTVISAQVDTTKHRPDVFRFADGVVYTLSSPVRWDSRDVLALGGVLAGTYALTFIDEHVQDFWQSHDNNFLNRVERIGYHYGKPYTAVGVTAGFYFAGVIFKSDWAKETGLMLGTSIFSSSIMMGVLKSAVGRGRPGVVEDNMRFRPFDKSAAYHAFPSGHSSVAFGLSLLLAKRIDVVPLKIFFYSLAGTTAVSRLYSNAHWISDIAFGGVLAWFFADTAVTRIQANRFRKSGDKDLVHWNVYPYPGGLTLRATL